MLRCRPVDGRLPRLHEGACRRSWHVPGAPRQAHGADPTSLTTTKRVTSMAEWTNSEDRRSAARAEYEHIMTTPSPDPTGAYIEAGVIGFVFGEMWRRGVLTPRDRRWITLSCV